jgi:YVTN family beta-propeller protein
MITPQNVQIPKGFGWLRALTGATFLALAACTQMVHPAPATQPAKAYVGLFKDNSVAVLDTGSNRVLRTIAIPPGPHGLVITPNGRKVYVSSDGASTVSVIETATDRVIKSIEVGPTPHGLAISPDGRQVLVAGFGTNQSIIIDTATDRVVGEVPVPQPHNSAISPDGRTAYVASQQQGSTALVILDLVNKVQIGRVPLEKTPRALAISPDGKWVYFTVAGTDAVQVLDRATNRVVGEIPVGASPHHPLFTPDGKLTLVVSQGPGRLEILDPNSKTVSASVSVGKAPHWIAVSSDGRTAYVTNEGSNDVSVVNLASQKVTATIPVGNAPRKIAVQPGPAAEAAAVAPAPGHATEQPTARSIKDVTGLAELQLEADEYYFAPAFLRGAPGQKLKLEIENESATLHSFTIVEQHLDIDIAPKGKAIVEVTFPQSGIVRFFCKFHSALGMAGELLAGDATLHAGP